MRVAIVGYGQLARMLALAGLPLGLKFTFLVDDKEEGADTRCVEGLGEIAVYREGLLGESLFEALHKPDVVTFEKEHVDLEIVKSLVPYTKIAPSVAALEVCQSRRSEKQLFQRLELPTARYDYTDSVDRFAEIISRSTFPLIIKSIRNGYDGKNQWSVGSASDAESVPSEAIEAGVIMEEKVPFLREVSLIGVRDHNGHQKAYPITENVHQHGILISSIAPANELDALCTSKVETYITKIMKALEYVGVMAIECFVTEDDILLNELAPRVHNSGHWTQEGAMTCQFENHLRAITGLPLGSTEQHQGVTGMINILGPSEPPRELLTERSTLHWYGKSSRKGRKMGHVNFISQSRTQLEETMKSFQYQIS